MEKELLDKEVFCIIDTRGIQKYMFHSLTIDDAIGADAYLKNIMLDALKYAAKSIDTPLSDDECSFNSTTKDRIDFLHDENVQIQVININAGNAMLLFRTGSLCEKIVRKISRYYLDNTYLLGVACSAVEKTDSFSADLNRLYRKLEKIKSNFSDSHPMYPLPIVEIENYTAEPCFKKVDGNYVSRASLYRRSKATVHTDYAQIQRGLSQPGPLNEKYSAIVHLDGNNMGMIIANASSKAMGYEQGIMLRRMISESIEDKYGELLTRTIKSLKEKYFDTDNCDEEFDKSFYVFSRGGDDLNFVCKPYLAMPFVTEFIEHATNTDSITKLNSITDFKLSICAGIAYVVEGMPFVTAYNYAEELCSSAKKTAKTEKNMTNGFCDNWIDFQVFTSVNSQNLEQLRETLYMTADNINLINRPFPYDDKYKDMANYLPYIIDKAKKIKKMNIPSQLFNLFEMSYVMGRQEYNSIINVMESSGYHLKDELGKPIYVSEDKNSHANWFDSIELSYFMDER